MLAPAYRATNLSSLYIFNTQVGWYLPNLCFPKIPSSEFLLEPLPVKSSSKSGGARLHVRPYRIKWWTFYLFRWHAEEKLKIRSIYLTIFSNTRRFQILTIITSSLVILVCILLVAVFIITFLLVSSLYVQKKGARGLSGLEVLFKRGSDSLELSASSSRSLSVLVIKWLSVGRLGDLALTLVHLARSFIPTLVHIMICVWTM